MAAVYSSPGYADFVVVTRHARAAQLEYRQHDPVVAQVAAEQRADDIMQQLEGLRDALRRQEATHAAVLHQLQAQGALQASSGDAPTGGRDDRRLGSSGDELRRRCRTLRATSAAAPYAEVPPPISPAGTPLRGAAPSMGAPVYASLASGEPDWGALDGA